MFGVVKKSDKTIGYLFYLFIYLFVFVVADQNTCTPISRTSFPSGFLFGAGSAAAQYEGAAAEDGKKSSIWDTFILSHLDRVADHSNLSIADDQYHRYKEDVAIIKNLGFDIYRFSISWPRILPNGNLSGGINQKGIDYYNNLINELLSNGIKPIVTLFHWDTPQALEDQYLGWLNPKIIDDFRDYVDLCFKIFGDRVKIWLTVNEPYTFSEAYASGSFAPGRCSNRTKCVAGNSGTEPYIVAHQQILAHATAVKLYKEKYQMSQMGEIGLALNAGWGVPNTNSTEDQLAVARFTAFIFDWFMEPLYQGSYPKEMIATVGNRLPTFTEEESNMIKGSYDFIGVNYYTSSYVSYVPCQIEKFPTYYTDRCNNFSGTRNGIPLGPQAKWIIDYPIGFKNLLLSIKNRYNSPVIYITENGIMDVNTTKSNFLDDNMRIQYYQGHLTNLREAIMDGVKVKGYVIWSLLDNFEWMDGYTSRFGIVYIDYENGLKRIPKQSVSWFKTFLDAKK